MNALTKILRGEPVLIGGAVTATLTVLATLGVNQALCAAIGAAAVAWLAVARGMVTPVAKAVVATRTAALDAAAQVASRLDADTAGPAGTITDHAVQLAETAADGAADSALRGLGVSRKERTK